jgi:hypothetical protein
MCYRSEEWFNNSFSRENIFFEGSLAKVKKGLSDSVFLQKYFFSKDRPLEEFAGRSRMSGMGGKPRSRARFNPISATLPSEGSVTQGRLDLFMAQIFVTRLNKLLFIFF